ncbi:MAG TPA: murein biosynthesis integral membrane protein MurJ [Ktedonobacteraceae bacterium]|nr:murein biosynthesis integral membrane protein MurJ [Ktedonobacteraceae bacterium]
MGNEGQQQPPLPPQGSPGQQQQPYYGWQYDQDQQDPATQHPPANPYPRQQPNPQQPPGVPLPPNMQQPPVYPAPPDNQNGPAHPLAARHQQPVRDMGTSLGYGQGMEYQYFNAPQPSQSFPQLRQERLQQLREDRMRRGQRRMNSNSSSLFPRRSNAPAKIVPPPIPGAPPPPAREPHMGQAPVEMSPSLMQPAAEASPRRSPMLPPIMQHSPAALPGRADNQLQPAAQSSQDTGMIQKARIGRATMILSGAFIASRILGLLRTSMFAYVFGTGITSDAFLQAFLVPDLIFNIVAGGALSSAFIPVFTHYMIGERDEKTAWHVASSALNLAIAIMMGLALLAIIFAPWLVPLYNPGVPQAELGLIISLSRIMFLQSIVLGGGVIITSILNAKQNFLQPAIGTVLYNVGLILGLVPGIFIVSHSDTATFLSHQTTAVFFATWGVVLGALLQVVVQIPGIIKVGMRYKPSFDYHHPGVIQIGRQMIPRVVNAAMLYVSTFVDRGLILVMVAPLLPIDQNGHITQYYQALQLILLPLGIFGMAISTAAFPTLAENVTRGRFDRVRAIIQDTLRTILFMSIPSSIGLIVLGLPIIQVLLQHGAYSLESAESTAVPLAFFAVGLAGLASVEILTRSFYAMRDSRTPVIVSIAQFILKIALSILFLSIIFLNQTSVTTISWGLGALALSTSLAGLLEAFVLLWLLQQRIGQLELRALARFAGRVLLASLAMGVALIVLRFILDHLLVTTNPNQTLGGFGTFIALIKLLLELGVGLFVYIRATRMLGIEEFWNQGPIKRVLERLKLSWI